MELNSMKDAFDRVAKKQKLASSKSQEIIEKISQEMEKALSRVQTLPDITSSADHKVIICKLKAKLKEIAPLLDGPQKELNIALSKYPKLLEKSLIPDISKAYRNIDHDSHTVNEIIASHFYREGQFDIGDCFVNESNEANAAMTKIPFLELLSKDMPWNEYARSVLGLNDANSTEFDP